MSQKHQEDLMHIRSMMERSSRFISLSGLSGVFAGLSALIGGCYVYFRLKNIGVDYLNNENKYYDRALVNEFFIVALIVLFFALTFGIFFTLQKSKKNKLPIWTSTTKKLLVNLAIPLFVGGLFCLSLLLHDLFVYIAPTMLLFYGLALINAEKYTFSDVKYLGYLELLLGCVSLFFLGKGLLFWIAGFGILHLLYGIILYKKYK
ncbi:fumarate reductase subunit D [Flavobacterium sp. 7E]|uniref:hypothetical protein n=1 Tax=unclassified Flavobacterium TaxID=196869 RepID=UPI00156DB504|nr:MULTISPECIES: hypothetical protein [unclassified Flavobacterium]NRS88904.1 fumarate reductase subunit D [Flavobacterium sp. 7E]NRT15799.1 fumarate reductase subunit D [Flavobacterium sp. 28A]